MKTLNKYSCENLSVCDIRFSLFTSSRVFLCNSNPSFHWLNGTSFCCCDICLHRHSKFAAKSVIFFLPLHVRCYTMFSVCVSNHDPGNARHKEQYIELCHARDAGIVPWLAASSICSALCTLGKFKTKRLLCLAALCMHNAYV